MTASTRAWLAAGLLALVGAAALHALALLGGGGLWGAMVHLTLFGWITALIVAVRYHTLPVFTGRDFPHPRLAWAHLALFAAGVTLASAALALGGVSVSGPLRSAGLALELGAALLFAANTLLLNTRGRLRGGRPIRPPIPGLEHTDRAGLVAAGAATAALPLAPGLMLAAHAGLLPGEGWLAAEHLMALGWTMLMIAGVGYHVLPRFSGRGLRGAAWARAQLGCHLAALALIVAGLVLGLPRVFAIGGALMAAATALFAWTIWPTLSAVRARPGTIALKIGAAK